MIDNESDNPSEKGASSKGIEEENATERLLIQANLHQSITSAVQNATDLLNNISSIEATVIGVASAKWLEDPTNVSYKEIIDNAKDNITFAVDNLRAVGEAGQSVLDDLKPN